MAKRLECRWLFVPSEVRFLGNEVHVCRESPRQAGLGGVVMQDVKVLDWRNRHAVQRDVRPRRAGGKVLLGKNVLDEDQLARCLPVPEAIVANRAWEPIRRSGEVTVMAPRTGIEVIRAFRKIT